MYALLIGQTEGKTKFVTPQGVTKARRRTPVSFLRGVYSKITDIFCNNFDQFMRWKGFRVLAADGTCVDMPDALRHVYGGPTNQRGECKVQARVSTIVSAFTGACISFMVGSYATPETFLTLKLVLDLKPTDLVILDRLYYSFGFIGTMISRKINFLVRARNDIVLKTILKEFGPGDYLCKFKVDACQRKKFPDSDETIIVRVIRFIPKGFRPVILITNIMPEIASAEELAHLYTKRWRVETVYGELKHVVDINNVRSEDPDEAMCELLGFMITYNLIRYIMQDAASGNPEPDKRYAVLYSFKHALSAVFAFIQCAIVCEDLQTSYDVLLKDIIGHPVLQRPGRHYPRPPKRTRTTRRRKHPLPATA